MRIAELEKIALSDRISVHEFNLDGETDSLAVYSDGIYAIAVDISKLNTYAKYKSVLAHEIGHCVTHSFYNIRNYLDVRSRHEYRADKWAIQHLIPEDDLRCAMMSGVDTLWDLADYFDVTEDLIRKAFWIYFDKEI